MATPLDAVIARIDAATNADAAVITDLRSKIGTGMSQTDVDAVNVTLGAIADHLEAIGKDPADVVPTPAPSMSKAKKQHP
jgi:hypothetical protein